MNYRLVFIVLMFSVSRIFAQEIAKIPDDTLAFSQNSKLYDCALISGFEQNTRFQIAQNSSFEFYHSLYGIPYSMNYSFDGVELNSIYDGGINLINFTGSYYKQPKLDFEGSVNAISRIDLQSNIPDKSSFSAITNFSNNRFLADIDGNYRKNNFFILTHANYNMQSAYNVPIRKSQISIDSTNHLLNSEFEGKSIFVKTGIIEDYSELTAEYLHVNNFRNIPVNYNSTLPEYLKENQYKMNLLSVVYKSRLSSNVSIRGNFYYRDNKRILDAYDDSSYSSQQKDFAFRDITKEQIIGFDFTTILNYTRLGQAEIGAFYKKMLLYEKPNYSLSSYDYVNEILGLRWSQYVPIGDKISVNANITYKYNNPVFPDLNGLQNKSLIEFSARMKHKLSNDFQYSAEYSKNGAFPYMKYIYSTNYPTLENNYCDIAELKFDFQLFKIPVQVYGYYTKFSNYFKNTGIFEQLSGSTSGGGLSLAKKFRYVTVNMSYTYLIQKNWNSLFLKLPANNLYISLSKEYEIGLKWQVEARISNGIGASANPTKLLDIWVQQKIINNINIYVYGGNILNEYYELYPGYPAQGFNLCFGFNVDVR